MKNIMSTQTNVRTGTPRDSQKVETTKGHHQLTSGSGKYSLPTQRHITQPLQKNGVPTQAPTPAGLEVTVSGEKNQTQKAMCCTAPSLRNVQNRQSHGDRK